MSMVILDGTTIMRKFEFHVSLVMYLHCLQHQYIYFLPPPTPSSYPTGIFGHMPTPSSGVQLHIWQSFYKVGPFPKRKKHNFRLQKNNFAWHYILYKDIGMDTYNIRNWLCTVCELHHTNMMVHPKSCVVDTGYMGKDCNDGIHTEL